MELPTARDIQRVLQFHNCVTLMGSHGGPKHAVKNMTLREKFEHVEAQLRMLMKQEAVPIENSVYRHERSMDMATITYADIRESLDKICNSEKLSTALMPPHPQVTIGSNAVSNVLL